MRMWKVVALLTTLGLVAPVSMAQDDLKKDVQELKKMYQDQAREIEQLKAENAALRDSGAVADTTLEQRINALSENLDYAGTTVKSVANPITIFGQARVRSGWTFDRDFGVDAAGPLGTNSEDPEDDDGSFVDALFLVGFDFELDKDVMVRVSMKANGLYNNGDTNAIDSETGTNSNLGEIDAYELFIQFNNIFGRKELGAREGRQEIVLGNEFQFGNNDFFSGETFDASHWWWDSENFALHFIWAKLSTTDDFSSRNWPYVPAGVGDGYDDDELYSLYFTLKSIEEFTLDLYWIYFNGHGSPSAGDSFGTLGNSLGFGSDFYYHTFGFRIAGVFDVAAGLDYNLELAYQTGDLTDGAPVDDVEGLAIEGEIGLTFDETNHFRIFIRGMWAEGPDEDGEDTGYIPLFPERHSQTVAGDHTARRARYGIMDIIPMQNVWSAQLGVTFDPAADWTLGMTILYAEHDEDVFTADFTVEDGIGFEIDAFGEYRYSAQTTLGGGIGVFFADEGAPFATGGFVGDDDDIAFLFFLQARVLF